MVLDFERRSIAWMGTVVSMNHVQKNNKNSNSIENLRVIGESEPDSTKNITKRATDILDVEYVAADLPKEVEKLDYLEQSERESLLKVLIKYKHLFDGTLGEFRIDPVSIELVRSYTPV